MFVEEKTAPERLSNFLYRYDNNDQSAFADRLDALHGAGAAGMRRGFDDIDDSLAIAPPKPALFARGVIRAAGSISKMVAAQVIAAPLVGLDALDRTIEGSESNVLIAANRIALLLPDAIHEARFESAQAEGYESQLTMEQEA